MASNVKFFGVLFVVSCIFSAGLCVQECYTQNCHECASTAVDDKKISSVRCEFKGIVGLGWLGSEDKNPVPIPPEQDVDYVCIKMTASNRNILGDSTDVIRGCVLKVTAEHTCDQLTGMEKSRGKEDTSCTYCENDLCNGAFSHQVPAVTFLMTAVIIVKFFSL